MCSEDMSWVSKVDRPCSTANARPSSDVSARSVSSSRLKFTMMNESLRLLFTNPPEKILSIYILYGLCLTSRYRYGRISFPVYLISPRDPTIKYPGTTNPNFEPTNATGTLNSTAHPKQTKIKDTPWAKGVPFHKWNLFADSSPITYIVLRGEDDASSATFDHLPHRSTNRQHTPKNTHD